MSLQNPFKGLSTTAIILGAGVVVGAPLYRFAPESWAALWAGVVVLALVVDFALA